MVPTPGETPGTDDGIYTATIQLVFGVTSVTVGASPGYATQDGASVTLPPPPPRDPPMVVITVTNHDPTEKLSEWMSH